MSFEEQLAKKEYYKRFADLHNAQNPIALLGELFHDEQRKENHDLSAIRFGQGELYFHYMDFEAAIFKWESIHNEYESWAKKNMADAYSQLGHFSKAEELYKSIVTESLILNTEIGIQLFSLYKESGNHDKADSIIKWVVSLNPDYPSVTELARAFFEEQEDWKSAVELAVNEGIRKESIQWFLILKNYVDDGVTKSIPPRYFEEPLVVLKNLKQSHFEQFLSSLWKSYEGEENYLTWVISFIQLFENMEIHEETWYETQTIYSEVFITLVSGRYLLKEIENIMPNFLRNWVKIADSTNKPLIYGAILSWNDYFPITLEASIVEEAEGYFMRDATPINTVKRAMILLSDILVWGKEELINSADVFQYEGKPLLVEGQIDLSSVHGLLESLHERERNEKLLMLVRNILNTLLDKKEEQKINLQKSIRWSEEILLKLGGAVNQLDDLQYGKNKVIKNTFQRKKEEMLEKIQRDIPEILKSCSELVREDSDFSKLHTDINNEMNQRVQIYLHETVLPQFKGKFQEWCRKAEIEFNESKLFMDEMMEGLNLLFAEKKLQLQCDFQVLNDWKRDMDRMTSYITYENENIFLRLSPSQFLLKSAGKLLGTKNTVFLMNQYKKQIENEDYSDVAASIAKKFLQQFNLFERTIERDIGMFFRSSIQELQQIVGDLEKEKDLVDQELHLLKLNPEKFYDPMILFQIRHRHYEWLNIGSIGSLNN